MRSLDLRGAFAWLLECELATYDTLLRRKKTAQCDLVLIVGRALQLQVENLLDEVHEHPSRTPRVSELCELYVRFNAQAAVGNAAESAVLLYAMERKAKVV